MKEKQWRYSIVKGIVFENTAIGKKEPDHAWKDGRPCMIIYSDSELVTY